MQPLKLRDQEMKRIEQAYQDLKKTSAKNKQLPEEPITDVRCLQTITKAKLVKRADMFIRKYGEPLTFWFYNEELATMTESNKRAFADLRTMDRLYYHVRAQKRPIPKHQPLYFRNNLVSTADNNRLFACFLGVR